MPQTLVEPDGSVEHAVCRIFNIVHRRPVLPLRQDATRAEPQVLLVQHLGLQPCCCAEEQWLQAAKFR